MHSRQKAVYPIYLMLLTFFILVFLALAALLWHFFIQGNLYICTDSVPFLSFIPPFVHVGNFGDVYVYPKLLVYIVWILFFSLSTFGGNKTAKLTMKRLGFTDSSDNRNTGDGF